MRYLGGKKRISKWVASHLLVLPHKKKYIEPFVGAGSVFELVAPAFQEAQANDLHPDLILLWQAIASGWIPPDLISKDEYLRLRDEAPSALRGFAGFGSSYSGVFFAGYCHRPYHKTHDIYERAYSLAAKDSLLKAKMAFANATITNLDYREVKVDENCLVYCDPPYRDTVGYKGTPAFDSDVFWAVAKTWTQTGATVVVSEASAPPEWAILAEQTRAAFIRSDKKAPAVQRREALYALP